MTAMTRERGAHCRTTCRLWRSAAVSTVALTIGVMPISSTRRGGSASPAEYAFAIRLRRVVLELGVLAEERELNVTGRAVALFGDDDVRDTLACGVLVVHFFAIDQENEVAILLQGSALSQIRHHRLLLLPLLDAAVQLRQRDHRHLQFLGQRLQRARNFRYFRGAIFLGAGHLHELQVVDHDQIEAALALQPARTCAHFGGTQRGSLVDVNFGGAQLRHGRVDSRPIVLAQAAGTQVTLIDSAEGRDHAQRERLGGHFHAEDGRRFTRSQRGILRDVDRERGLSHGRPAGHDDQIASVEARGHFVELGEAGGDARQLAVRVVHLVDPVDDVGQDALDRAKAHLAARAALGDFEHDPLGIVDDFPRLAAFGFEGAGDNPVARGDELPQDGSLADDVGIRADVGGGGRITGQGSQVRKTPHLIQHTLAFKVSGKSDGVAGLVAFDQAGDGLEDEPMVVAVEVLGDHTIRDLVPGGGIEHQTAQHRLLGLDRMGRQAEPLAASARTQDSISDASRHAKPARRGFAGRYSSATIVTVTVTLTSVCRCSCTWCSPVERIGPFGMRTSLRWTACPALTAASAMSAVPIDPNNLPSEPALALSSSLKFSKFAARVLAAARCSPAFASSSWRCASNLAMLAGVAMVARPVGTRKL